MSTFENASNSHLIPWMVTDKVTWIPLRQFRQKKGAISVKTLHTIFVHVAQAMMFAHDNDLIVGNFDDTNIVIEYDENVSTLYM